MNNNRVLMGVFSTLLLIGSSIASAAVVTVTPGNPSGWFEVDQAGAATGAVTTTQARGPGNTGSLEFTTSGSTADKIHAARLANTRMSDIEYIGYDFYSNHASFAPAIKLQYQGLNRFGTLIWEPVYNGGHTPSSWATANATTGQWWSTEGTWELKSFADWQADIGNIPVTFLQVGVGSGWDAATTGHADVVRLATGNSDTTWDFEGDHQLPPPLVSSGIPTTSTWALITLTALFGLTVFFRRKQLV